MEPAPRLFDDPSFHEQQETAAKQTKRRKKYVPIEPEILNQIWEHYLKLLASGRGVKPRLTEERTVLISRAVHDYGAAIIKQAIRGCSLSPWHMGHNPNGKKYTSIELILRDSEHIERFASYAEDVDTKGGFLDD